MSEVEKIAVVKPKLFARLKQLKLKKPSGAVVAIFCLLFFISMCIGISIKLLFMYRNLRLSTLASAGAGQTTQGQATDSQFNARVSQLADTVAGEVPQEAVINNIDKAREQNEAFYSQAINGDILLLYKHRAVIYSPTKDRIAGMLWIP
jgi:hypothetical protein